MNSELPTFSVCTLCRDTPYNVRRFVSWYLDQGAERIHVFFDNPDDPAIDELRQFEKVKVYPLTNEVRSRIAHPAVTVHELQKKVGDLVYQELATDWLLRIDCDELVTSFNGSLRDFLKSIPDECEVVVVAPYEETLLSETGKVVFRGAVKDPELLEQIYGEAAGALASGRGMVGHVVGKSFIRRKLAATIREHGPRSTDRDRKRFQTLSLGIREGVACLHLNRESFETWRRKLPWRLAHSSVRPLLGARVIEALLLDVQDINGASCPNLKRLYASITTLNAQQAALLQSSSALISEFPNFGEIMAALFPDELCVYDARVDSGSHIF